MFKFLKNLFNQKPKYTLGSFESPIDTRNIPVSAFQTPKSLPNYYETEMPPVENQGPKSKCVGSAIHKVKELYLKEKGAYVDLSDDDLYEQCKKEDKIPEMPGTYPLIGAKVACGSGIATVEAYSTKNAETIAKSRLNYKLGGYAFVSSDFESVCQAIYQNKAIIASFSIDSNWFVGLISKVIKSIGRHCVILHGFKLNSGIIIGQNSWGVGWIGRIYNMIGNGPKDGHFEMIWSDYENNVSDLICFTDVPQELIDNAKKENFYFINTLRIGSKGYEVQKLQERLGLKADGSFGMHTHTMVMAYQKKNGLGADGIVGKATRDMLNKKVSKLELWINAIKIMEGAKPYRNNPGNIRFVGQQYAVNDNGFCKFDTYEHGYDALKNLIVRACTGMSKKYNPEGNLYDFYDTYAPSSDGNNPSAYANFVASKIGVPATTKIKDLL